MKNHGDKLIALEDRAGVRWELQEIRTIITALLLGAGMSVVQAATQPEPVAAMVTTSTVRVVETPGGPQIHVDGKPIPPRFFFGAMNSGPLTANTQWTLHAFEFSPGEVKGTGTLHFRFAEEPGDVWLADLRIQDTATSEDILPPGSFATAGNFEMSWSQWPSGPANTVGTVNVEDGAVHVVLKRPAAGKWPDFHLHTRQMLTFSAGRTYRCTFRTKAAPDKNLTVALYSVVAGTWTWVGGPPGSFFSQITLARDAGVNLVSFSAPNCWTPPDQPIDWSPLDTLCRQIIAVNPNVLLVPRVTADAPPWWLERHPAARMIYDGNQVANYSCVSDRDSRFDVCAHLEKISRHLLEAFPERFAGIHPVGQSGGEWVYHGTWKSPLSGYDAATKTAFRAWLKARGDAQAERAEPPTADERRAHPTGFLRDPSREKRLIEFARFQQQEMADHVAAMAAACRRGTDGKKLVLFFYGYLFEFPTCQNGAPTCGHYALSTLLKSRDIDILCSPISYTDRDWIGTAPSMTAAESVMQSGILWLNEDDSRTFLDPRKQEHVQEGGLVDLEQTRQVMRRNTAQAALRGFGTWWMDLPTKGWFNDARIWEELSLLRPVDLALLARKARFTPEIAAIVDEDSMCHLTGGSAAFARNLIYDSRAALGRSGAPYGQYLLDDAMAGHVPAKLQVYLAAWALSPEERTALAAQRNNATVRIWCYAPGYLYSDRMDVAGIRELTGFDARALTLDTAEATPTEAGKSLGLAVPWGPKQAIRPLFSVTASRDETLATYADGSSAVAVRHTGKGIDVFVGVPQLTPELVRACARMAGVHVFTEGKATVWAADGYLSVQAHETGTLLIDIGKPAPVMDALYGMALGQGPLVTLPMKKGEVRVLKY